MESPQGVPMYRLAKTQILGSPWTLLGPGRFATRVPDEVRGMIEVSLKVNNRLYWRKFVVEPQQEWLTQDDGVPALRSLAERTGGLLTDDIGALSKEIARHRRVGGLSLHFVILLGVVALILLSVSRLRSRLT